MDVEKLEQKLEKSVDEMEARDFSLVWDDIKDRVSMPKKRVNKRRLAGWISAAAVLVCVVIAGSIVLPIIGINQDGKEPEVSYFMDELGITPVEETQFYEELKNANIKHVDLSKYIGDYHGLFQTEDKQTKGASVQLIDDWDNPMFILDLQFYDDKVKERAETSDVFDMSYTVNGVKVNYRIKDSNPAEGWYIFDLKANYNSVNYYMEYACFTDDVKPFLDEFFK
ncbi:MAG: hypothetical protein IJB97_09255 [Clostridia bacterium]|nr:hypothetical protein [Clostridia bacterium]